MASLRRLRSAAAARWRSLRCRSSARAHRCDVALDEARVGLAVEVRLDDLLGQLDDERGDLTLQLARHAVALGAHLLGVALTELGTLGLGPGDDVTTHLLGLPPRLLDDARRLG